MNTLKQKIISKGIKKPLLISVPIEDKHSLMVQNSTQQDEHDKTNSSYIQHFTYKLKNEYEEALTFEHFLFEVEGDQPIKESSQRILGSPNSEFMMLVSDSLLRNDNNQLICLLYFIQRYKFDLKSNPSTNLSFYELILKKMKEMQEDKSGELDDPANFKRVLESLKTLVERNILSKADESTLNNSSQKKEIVIPVDLTDRQKEIYKTVFKRNFETLYKLDKKENSQKRISLKTANNILLALRLWCDHPLLLSHKYNKRLRLLENFETDDIIDPKRSDEDLINKFQADLILSSGKMQVFDKLLTQLLKEGRKIMVFSQFKSMLNILEDYLHYKEVNYLNFDNDTTSEERHSYIQHFNHHDSKFPVFLLSTKAGSIGNHLTSADTILIFDSDFSCVNKLQMPLHSIDRRGILMVYRLVSANSCEQGLVETAKEKYKLAISPTDIEEPERISNSTLINRLLKYGTKIIFESKSPVLEYDEEMIEKLTDRGKFSHTFNEPEPLEEYNKDWEEILGADLESEKAKECDIQEKEEIKDPGDVQYFSDHEDQEREFSEYDNLHQGKKHINSSLRKVKPHNESEAAAPYFLPSYNPPPVFTIVKPLFEVSRVAKAKKVDESSDSEVEFLGSR